MKNSNFETTVELSRFIRCLFDDSQLSFVLQRMANVLALDVGVLNRYFGNSISNAYNHRLGRFGSGLSIWNVFISIGQVWVWILAVPLFSHKGKWLGKDINCHVLIDGIQSKAELERWTALKAAVKEDIVFLTKVKNIAVPGFDIIGWKPLYGYKTDRYFLMVCRVCFFSFVPFLILSFKYKINFFNLLLRTINDLLYYRCVFSKIKSRYLVQDRNLGSTNAIRNFLFKHYGGIASCCVQKNIWQSSGTALYTDTDVLFAIGRRTGELVLSFDSRVEKTYAVGSMSMQNALLGRESAVSEREVLDILFVGSNTSTDLRRDWAANYEAIAWLVQIANACPHLKVGIKHHQNSIPDLNEAKITKGSRVIYINPDMNSYAQALDSRIVVSYASTLIYEMIGLGKDAYFLDPKGENTFINPFVSNNYIIKDVETLKERLAGDGTDKTGHFAWGQTADYCIPSLDVVRGISAVISPD